MSFPTFPQHGELPATPLPPREAQRGPAGFEKLPAHVLGRGRHRAEHGGLGPDPWRTLLCPLRTGPVRGAQHKQRASSVRATVPPAPCHSASPEDTPSLQRGRRWGPRVARALSPHWPSAWETRMGWGLKAAVGLAPGLWGAWAKSERARPASRTVGGSHRE